MTKLKQKSTNISVKNKKCITISAAVAGDSESARHKHQQRDQQQDETQFEKYTFT